MNLGVTFEGLLDSMLTDPEAFSSVISAMVATILLGALLTFIYSLILTFLFYFVTYAIVVDDMSVIKAYKKSCSLLKQNFLKVFVFIVLILVSSVIWYVVSIIITIPFSFIAIMIAFAFMLNPWVMLFSNLIVSVISSIVYLIFIAVVVMWSTRFYMSVTGQLCKEEKQEDLQIENI